MTTSTLTPGKKERLSQLQVVRAIAIMGVITVHSTSYATLNMLESNYYWLYNFLNIFMKFGTPTFIALSSFVLFYNYMDRPLDRKMVSSFYKRRLLYIVIPYVLFSLFYFGLQQYLNGSQLSLHEMTANFIDKLLTGKAYTHLYFVFINMQFYILFPLFLWLFKSSPRLARWAIPIGLVLQWAFVLGNKYYFQVDNRGSWSLSYFSYYMLGATLGIYYNQLKTWLIICREYISAARIGAWLLLWTVWLGSGLTHVYIWYENRLYSTAYNSTWFDLFYSLYAFTSVLVLLQLSFLLYRGGRSWTGRILSRLGSFSFGIYLIHPFFLLVYRRLVPESGNSLLEHAWYAGGFLTALLCSWLVVYLAARYLPFAWLAFGSLPKTGAASKPTTATVSKPTSTVPTGNTSTSATSTASNMSPASVGSTGATVQTMTKNSKPTTDTTFS
ncbi:acyltransferase [Paenibacillus sp. WLX1005]|uniref:acyltransferase n=1 Tax=Paenibacillus sp. WLX1005 TaxID=3243766 RepID=UPI00398458B2